MDSASEIGLFHIKQSADDLTKYREKRHTNAKKSKPYNFFFINVIVEETV